MSSLLLIAPIHASCSRATDLATAGAHAAARLCGRHRAVHEPTRAGELCVSVLHFRHARHPPAWPRPTRPPTHRPAEPPVLLAVG